MFGKGRIRVDAQLWRRATQHAQELGYASLNDFVAHLLEKHLQQTQEQAAKQRVLEKMKGLGYLQ
ncbi:MAG: hypothetical protein ACM359_25035 [Bacillota bacterium]